MLTLTSLVSHTSTLKDSSLHTTDLFVLSRIQVDPTSIENPQGGGIQILEPWKVGELALSPLTFAYNFPKKNV